MLHDLTLADLAAAPAWEFAFGRAGATGACEALVRPICNAPPVDPKHCATVVRASFELADGTPLAGYLTPQVKGSRGIARVQPVIVTDAGQVPIWLSGFRLLELRKIVAYLALLGRPATRVFPLRYASDVELVGGPVSGVADGFMFHDADSLKSLP